LHHQSVDGFAALALRRLHNRFEQRSADDPHLRDTMLDLKSLAADRYRITLDESASEDTDRETKLWCYRLPCRYGFISVHGVNTLAAYTRGRMVSKLEALEGVTVHQRGDQEVRILFHPDRLDAIAELLKARKRRRLSDDQKARLALAGAKFRYPPRRTDARNGP
jgi:hypothetical protein